MFSKRQLILISYVLAVIFHFIFYFGGYGPSFANSQSKLIYLPALLSSFIMVFLYFFTYWRRDLDSTSSSILYDILIIWIFICFIRSVLEMTSLNELVPFLFYNYLGISLFPVLFFIAGINYRYYRPINRILSGYIIAGTFVSLLFVNYFELQVFILMPIFYIILTIPLRNSAGKIFVLAVTIMIIALSFTNRAGILRIIISASILLAFYLMQSVRISRSLIKGLVFAILLIPVVSMYFGLKGDSIFQVILGEDTQPYSQMNPYADTRTFLYYEVFQDLKINKALLLGKGLNATYASEAFQTFGRPMVEVGFLQILLKSGIVGVILYLAVIIRAIYLSLGKSTSVHLKSLGLLLSGYVIMLFIENVIAYNLLNVLVWIIVGMCYSPKLRALSDAEFKAMFGGPESIRLTNRYNKV